MSDLIEVCGLWTSEGKNGRKYLAGNSGKLRYWIFPNDSDNAKAPTHRLMVSANKKREEDDAHPAATDDTPF